VRKFLNILNFFTKDRTIMDWNAPPHYEVFSTLMAPPLPRPLEVQVPDRAPVLHQDTKPPLTARQLAWQAEKEINRNRKKIERAYGRPWHVLMKLIGEA
jgi:hypothetical protein